MYNQPPVIAMNIIDEATSYRWVYPIPLKSTAFVRLKDWVLLVERGELVRR